MKLKLKLPLAFAATLTLLLCAALFAIFVLNRSLTTFDTVVSGHVAQERAVKDLTITFKGQVQEWKDVLLRGKDPAALDKYWAAFEKKEQDVADKSKQLVASLPEGDSKQLMQQFVAAHQKMGEDYRKGLEAYKQADFLFSAGDAAVKGMDREPTKLLNAAADKIAKDTAAISTSASGDGKQAITLALVVMSLVSVIGIIVGVVVSRVIVRPLERAVEVARAVAGGDLTSTVKSDGRDEIGELLSSLNEMQAHLTLLVQAVRQDAEGVAAASTQIAQGNVDLSSRTEEQASALQQTAASVEQLAATVRQSAESAMQADQLAGGASDVALKGGDVVNNVIETMKGIHEGSKRIADIIGVIDSIAFQTNILALNAAVEAARAGEQGRGFAVVASEVRALAQRSATAAREIKALIGDSVARVERGSELVSEAGGTMSEVVQAIRRVKDIMGELSAASREQSAGVGQINLAVSQMDTTTQQNAALVEEAAAAAESLKGQSHRLVDAVAVFRISDQPRLGLQG